MKLTRSTQADAATPLERVVILLASLVLAIGLIALLSGFFAGRDAAGVSGVTSGPGETFRDLGHAHLKQGETRPAYNSRPPTSGAHFPELVVRDGTVLSDDELLEALELGDVVVMFGGSTPPSGLTTLARSVAPAPFSPTLAAAGQAVILARRPGLVGLIGLAWTRALHVNTPEDPRLGQFARVWLGRGAPGR